MGNLIDFLSQPWPWYVAGPLIALTMFLLIYFGNTFGVSSNFKTVCAMAGAGRRFSYFNFDWKSEIWNLIFILGSVIGGAIASLYLLPDTAVEISEITKAELSGFGVADPGTRFVPTDIFSWEGLVSLKGFVLIVIGGFFVGFGTRYAGGCTSGHAITGLSNLQLPSLIAVIGFFIGGLFVTYLIMPFLLPL